MARKYELITELYNQTVKRISRNQGEWRDFLRSACFNYKLSFSEQLLVYAQRPNATAVLELEKWNEQFGRWVNKGATGIAVFDDEHNGNNRLKYYFDISDTHESRFSRPVPLWDIEQRYEDDVIETLEGTFGTLEYKDDLPTALIYAATNAVEDNFSDYLSELMYCREDSFLEELDELNVEKYFKEALECSVSYMLLERCCGGAVDDYRKLVDFSSVINFNTRETLNALGTATSDIAEMALREISATVRNLQIAEKKQIRTFAENLKVQYPNNTKNISNSERSFDNGNHIQQERKLQHSQSDSTAGSTGNSPWEIRIETENISETEPQGDVHQSSDIGQAERASNGNRTGGNEPTGTDSITDGEVAGRDRTDESHRPNEMGGIDEQHSPFGGGNGVDGTGLQLKLFPTVEEQIAVIEQAEDKNSSAFAISQQDIDDVLANGSGVEHGKYRIYEQFQKNEGNKANSDFLKNEYGWGGAYPILRDRDIDEGHDGKGIKISRGSIAEPDAEILLPWNKVAKRIGELVAADRYLNAKEKEHYPAYLREVEERRQQYAEEQAVREILSRNPAEQEELPAKKENVTYDFHLGDTVYLGADEYEILAFDENTVRLYDNACPIINKEIPRDEFDRKLRENPMNNHLVYDYKERFEEARRIFDSGEYVVSDKLIQYAVDELEMRGIHSPTAQQIAERVEADIIEQDTEPQDLDTDDEEITQDTNLIGTEVIIDDRTFIIESVDEDDVKMRDITFQDSVGFPIFRSEKLEFVRMYLPDERPIEEENLTLAPPQAKPKSKVQTYDIHPEIPLSDRHNFHITDDNLGVGGTKTKFQYNIAAIKTLQEIEFDNRFATPEEQEILSKYVGWGGLPQAFDEKNEAWSKEFTELYTLLSPDEYASARASTLNAHYTSPTVIKAIYQAIENMGFKTGNVLEPACGVGNFFGLVPKSMQDSKLYGIELDSVTGRIAQQLYQKNSIAVQGFENTALPDSFFDLAIGNVPFGSYTLSDKKYDKHKFLIHDYFFAKTLDKVRPNGIIAFVTSKGTLDKQNPAVRKYIAQRADLLGAIRLPNNAFKGNAGTEVTTDIIFLQKRDRIIDIEPDWVHLNTNENGLPINSYFTEHPEMILGEMMRDDMMYGNQNETTCMPYPDADLSEQLAEAIQNIHAEITDYEIDDLGDEEDNSIPADPTVRNFSYTLVDGQIYFREDSRMHPVSMSVTADNRIKGMLEIRECVRTLIEYQTEDYPDSDIGAEQAKLNRLYDAFVKKYGRINDRANDMAFSQDSSYCLLCSLEVLDDENEFERKADMFSKRTIKPKIVITSVDTAVEALGVSLGEKACVDLGFMGSLMGGSDKIEQIIEDLQGVIFKNPNSPLDRHVGWETADEYLSGNVRKKLETAVAVNEVTQGQYAVNVKALQAVQPKDLTAGEIDVQISATWLPPDVIQTFIFQLLDTPWRSQNRVKVLYCQQTGEWNVTEKSHDKGNIKAINTYGTKRINAYKIIEDSLNMRDVRIFDTVYEDGKEKRVLNKKETAIAQSKQELIKSKFKEWVWEHPARRERLCNLYNEKFNSIRPREYDGKHLRFTGMSPEIELLPHQINAVARAIYGGNTLLAHCVGAGKTYEMIATAMESKHLGLCNKSLFVVPNNIVGQIASDFLQLYPSANILMATKKDFETKNRKKFCARIATGEYDGIIIGHSQFEKIPMSIERQEAMLRKQINDIVDGISDLKENNGERYTIKQMEKTKKSLEAKLDKLNDQSRKDDVVTFEELGVDRLFVDEADMFKNLFLYTKMRNVGGIAQTEAQKSSDLFMKVRYLDELTNNRGTIFATGTPVSNTMAELYTMQRYLQYDALAERGLQHFDAWASNFGETVTAYELTPEGTGFQQKTRFAYFHNLPELMNMFREVADIQTADMLDLPVPKANYHTVVLKPSEIQKETVMSFAKRADDVRNRRVEPYEDNMLLITNDGRKLALDQRLINPMLPDNPDSKANACANDVYRKWEDNKEDKLTQLVFCDISTPKNNGSFSVYNDIREKLEAKGIPHDEIAFIHDADNEVKKKELFAKVRKGQVRILLGSTFKMGAGTNIQDRLIALHDVDCPWRPRDLEQRRGRIVRRGNNNPEVDIIRYVTEGTFDSYMYQMIENKQKFISQIMTSKSPVRSIADVDEAALSYAEIKALATGNPHIIEKCNLEADVAKLNMLKGSHLSQRYDLEDKVIKVYPQEIKRLEERIRGYTADIAHVAENTKPNEDGFSPMVVLGVTYTEKKAAGTAIIEACKTMTNTEPKTIGSYRGFEMELCFDSFGRVYNVTLKNELRHTATLGTDIHGNITRIDNALDFPIKLQACEEQLQNTHTQMETAKAEAEKPFSKEEELQTKTARLNELNILLKSDKNDTPPLDCSPDENDVQTKTKNKDLER